MKYKVVGQNDKPLMIFITGAGIGPFMWKHQVEYFNDYKKIIFNLPGHGDNADESFTTIEDVGHKIIRIIEDESTNGKAIIIGHSIGAQTVMWMIKYYSDCIEKAIVISGLNKQMKGMSWLVKPLIQLTMPLIKLRSFAKVQSKQLSLQQDMFEEYYTDSLLLSGKSLSNIIDENMSFVFESEGNNTYPETLVIVGDREKNIMKKSAIKTTKVIGNDCYYSFARAAHGIPYEMPEELNKLIGLFIIDKHMAYEQNGVKKCQL